MEKVIEMLYTFFFFCTKSSKPVCILHSAFHFELATFQVFSSHSMAMGLQIVYFTFLHIYLYCSLLYAFQGKNNSSQI